MSSTHAYIYVYIFFKVDKTIWLKHRASEEVFGASLTTYHRDEDANKEEGSIMYDDNVQNPRYLRWKQFCLYFFLAQVHKLDNKYGNYTNWWGNARGSMSY